MNTRSPSNDRIAAFDAIRALAAFTGIFLHGGLAYVTFHQLIPWINVGVHGNVSFDIICSFLKMFRSPLFFLLAGYFAHHTYKLRGLGYLTRHRCISIGIPFLVLIFGLPLLYFAYAYTMHDVSALNTAKALANDTGSLWFLYDLVIFYVVTLVALWLVKLLPTTLHQHLKHFMHNRYLLALVILLSLAALLTLSGSFTPTDIHLNISPALPIYYGAFFIVGWLCFQQKNFFLRLLDYTWCYCIAGLVVYLGFVYAFFTPGISPKMSLFCYGLGSWLWTWAFLSLGFKLISKPNRVIRYFADSAYWIYISQIPPIMYAQMALSHSHYSVWTQYALVCAIAFAYCLLTYQLLVRKTWVGIILRGGKRWRKPKAKSAPPAKPSIVSLQ